MTPAPYRPTPRAFVGALWLFAILNYLYCDVLGTHDPDYLAGILANDLGGLQMTDSFLLGASVLMTIPMSAVLVSRIAPHRLARWWSIVAGAIMTLVQAGSLGVGMDATSYYLYFSVIEIATTAAIVWIAVRRWKVETVQTVQTVQTV